MSQMILSWASINLELPSEDQNLEECPHKIPSKAADSEADSEVVSEVALGVVSEEDWCE